jgi:preprotein translocase subunit SecF
MSIPAPPGSDVPGVTRRHRFSDLYHERTNFRFIERSRTWAILSTALMVLSVGFLLVRGLNLGIEFKGGTEWRVKVAEGKEARVQDVRDVLDPLGFADSKVTILTDNEGDQNVRVQARVIADPTETIAKAVARYAQVTQAAVQFENVGEGGKFTTTTKDGVNPDKAGVENALRPTGVEKPTVEVNGRDVTVTVEKLPPSPVREVAGALATYAGAQPNDVNITTVGPTWGRDISEKAVRAMVIFFVLLAVYLSLRFEWKMALSAIVAVFHDVLFTAGFYAAFRFQVTPATVTALLTILGFSLYDTVVVFDKVAEYQRTLTATGRSTYGEMVNRALNAVLMRSLSTSLVAVLPVASLLVVGSLIMKATALEDFGLALAVGLLIGSYSSLYVAAPLLAWWKEKEPRYRALADRRRRTSAAAASAALGVPVVPVDEPAEPGEAVSVGVPGPPAVPRGPVQPRPRQQRRRKRR